MDYRIFIGVVIHALIVLALGAVPDMRMLALLLAPFLLLNVIGMALIWFGVLKAGCITCMVGSAAFVPIGMIGFFGARAMLDRQRRQTFMEQA